MVKKEVNIDVIGKGSARGDVAQTLQTNGRMDVGHMRPWIDPKDGKAYVTVFKGGDPKNISNYQKLQVNAGTLRRDEWLELDKALQRVNRERLTVVDDVLGRGLTYNLGNAFGTTVLEYHSMSEALEAQLSMDGVVRGPNDAVEFESHYLPIPILHVDYQINLRVLEASRRLGNPLDTTQVEIATRRIKEKLEDLLIGTSNPFSYAGGKIYGYLTHPSSIAHDLTGSADSLAPDALVDHVIKMKQALVTAKHYGPYMIYFPGRYSTLLDKDYNSTKGITIKQRLEQIDGVAGVKVVDRMPVAHPTSGDNVELLMVQMTSDVVRIVNGLPLQNVEWKSEGNFVTNYKVLTIQVPQVRTDHNGNPGVVFAFS